MSASIDKDPAEEGEDARGVLAGWLDDYSSGRCEREDMQESFLSVCRSNADAPWDALALLDQYQRRGRIDPALARSLKADIAQLVFGVANQTEAPRERTRDAGARDTTEATLDTTGSRWRKLFAERDPESINAEPGFADPTVFHRDFDPVTRPPPPARANESAAANRAPSTASDVLRDRYELLSILGRGSGGTVYKALDRRRAHLPKSARCVALKVLNLNYQDRPDALAELEHEFHQAQSLSHPSIVSVFDLDRDGDTYFIVMELVEGELLADVLRRLDGRPMSREHAFGIISQVGSALAHAHRREVVHADLKPRNIMITVTGEVRVLDFGFASHRPLDLHSASSLHDSPIAAPAYASVGRVNGGDAHSGDDVYSLACIAYELLSGQHPFGGKSATLARAQTRRPRRIRGLTHRQWHVLLRALTLTRGERRVDVVELLNGLGCADVPSRPVPPELLTPDDAGSRRLRAFALAAFVFLVCGAAAFLFWRLESSRPVGSALPVAPTLPGEKETAEDPTANEAVQESRTEEVSGTPAEMSGQSSQAAESAPPAAKPVQTAPPPEKPAVSNSAPAAPPAPAPGPATLEFDKDTFVATESDGSVRLVIKRGGSAREAVNFTWALRENSAEAGVDFAAIGPGAEQIPAGARQTVLMIPLVSDALVENTEVFLVELESSQPGVSVGERANAAVIIVDDD